MSDTAVTPTTASSKRERSDSVSQEEGTTKRVNMGQSNAENDEPTTGAKEGGSVGEDAGEQKAAA